MNICRLAPFAAPRANFLHAALGLQDLEAADPLPPGGATIHLRSSHARSRAIEHDAGLRQRFDGEFHEWLGVDAAFGAAPGLELGAQTALAGWDEQRDRFFIQDGAGRPLVRDEDAVLLAGRASKRHDNLNALGARCKLRLLGGHSATTALRLAARFPVGRPRDITHPGVSEGSMGLAESVGLGPGRLHLNLGATTPLGSERIFVPHSGVELRPAVQSGAAYLLPLNQALSVGLQLEAQRSAFEHLPFHDGIPVNLVAGLRRLAGRSWWELGGGRGLDVTRAYHWMGFLGWGYRF